MTARKKRPAAKKKPAASTDARLHAVIVAMRDHARRHNAEQHQLADACDAWLGESQPVAGTAGAP